MQHAPKRVEYDGFPGYKLHSIEEQIHAVEIIGGKKVVAIAINHEEMEDDEIGPACELATRQTGLPAFDVLAQGPEGLTAFIKTLLKP
jgi:uncharacterized NAD-dependent epimerase/dehydratase family protein